jgi:glyoxylase-like metal-dependent hydrolase (beta-lactamase superfamily II)
VCRLEAFDLMSAHRRPLLAASACILTALVAVFARTERSIHAQQRPTAETGATALEVLAVRPNVYLITGAGSNISVLVGRDGLVVVDAGSADHADAAVAAIKKISNRPIRYVIDTSDDADHVGGNEKVAKAGQTLFTLGNAFATAMTNDGAAAILAAEPVLTRMSAPTGSTSPYPAAAWPTESFARPRKYMRLNDEAIEVFREPAAHTDGDSIVFFRGSDVVIAGDIIDTRHFPVIDLARGGSIQGEIAALNRLVDLAVPSVPLVFREGGTMVITGHGRLYDQTDVAEYRDMITIIRDRVQDLVSQHKTLNEVKAAKPAQGYSKEYGASGPWSTDMFIEAVYKSLTARAAGR